MPDRVFEKGKAGRRSKVWGDVVLVKMKDSTPTSFREESEELKRIVGRKEKAKIIEGRKMEELNRVKM